MKLVNSSNMRSNLTNKYNVNCSYGFKDVYISVRIYIVISGTLLSIKLYIFIAQENVR
jgi:hypothetical protein